MMEKMRKMRTMRKVHKMRIDILTLFPEMFDGVLNASIIGKARENGHVDVHTLNFRSFANNKHNTVDDYPYGGGAGMVLQPEPIFNAVESIVGNEASDAESAESADSAKSTDGAESAEGAKPRIILLCPQGEVFTQRKAVELAQEEHLIMICGHYEGYDERIRQHLVTDEISVGDYVLTGGEIPAMIVLDSVVRLLPGVLGNEQSALTDSFGDGGGGGDGLLEHPHYTRPAVFRDWAVPDVLLSGHHANIETWRRKQSLLRTWQRRPELIDEPQLSGEERGWLEQFERGEFD